LKIKVNETESTWNVVKGSSRDRKKGNN